MFFQHWHATVGPITGQSGGLPLSVPKLTGGTSQSGINVGKQHWDNTGSYIGPMLAAGGNAT